MAPTIQTSRVVLALLLAAGCAADAGVPAPSSESARAALEQTAVLPILDADAALRMVARVESDGEPTPVELRIDEGWIALAARPDGTLVIESLDVTVDDLVLGESGGPLAGLHLADISASLVAPTEMETVWLVGAQGVIGTAPIEIELNWSIVTDRGEVIQITPQRIAEIELSVHAYLSADGEIEIEISAARSGVFWEWARTVELSDLDLEALAIEG